MFKPQTILCLISVMLAFVELSAASVHSFSGSWINPEADISRLHILVEADGIYVQAWSKCGAEVCDWGRVEAEAYGQVSQGNTQPTLTATFDRDDCQVLLVLSTDGDQVEAKMVSMQQFGLSTHHAKFLYEKETPSIVSPAASPQHNMGSIYGKALGMAKSTSSIFHVSLYGPDNPNRVQGTQHFTTDRTYAFDKLADGTYWLIVDSKGMTGIQAFPNYQEIVIKEGIAYVQNVELK